MMTRNSMELCLFSTMGLAVGGPALHLSPLPGSLRNIGMLGQATVLLLLLGCLIAITGILWRSRDDGLIIEQLGLVGVGVGSLFYACALVLGPNLNSASIALGMSVGVAFGCAARYFQIQRYIRRRKQAARSEQK